MSRSAGGTCANPQVGDCAVSRGSVSNRPFAVIRVSRRVRALMPQSGSSRRRLSPRSKLLSGPPRPGFRHGAPGICTKPCSTAPSPLTTRPRPRRSIFSIPKRISRGSHTCPGGTACATTCSATAAFVRSSGAPKLCRLSSIRTLPPGRGKPSVAPAPHLVARAASFMLLADSRASFEIEGERPRRNRLERWGRAVNASRKEPDYPR